MAQKAQTNLEKSTSEAFLALWSKLTRNQRRFVVAMQDSPTKKDAAEAIGLEPNTVYSWPKIVDDAVERFADDVEAAALDIILANAGKAAMVKAAGLDSGDERTRQQVASEILDRVLGKPTQRQELAGPGGGPVPIQVVREVRPDDS